MGEVYHVYNKSIAEYTIFNNDIEYSRMLDVVCYYQIVKPRVRFSEYMDYAEDFRQSHQPHLVGEVGIREVLVDIVAYCLMPTHLHLVLKEIIEGGIPTYVSRILNSYSRYFNIKHKRKGPLWEGRSKKVLATTDEQLLHTIRYVHLNPVTAELVKRPEDWKYSSYKEYINELSGTGKICKFDGLIDISSAQYAKFVEDQIPHQKELAKIKRLALGSR